MDVWEKAIAEWTFGITKGRTCKSCHKCRILDAQGKCRHCR